MYVGSVYATTHIAPAFGRVALTCDANSEKNYVVMHPLYCWFNRNYVTPVNRNMIDALGNDLNKQFPDTKLPVLDANFPFIDGFPLLPHLSHDDGRKVDFAFFYQDNGGNYLPGVMRSPIGFWAFEEPNADETQPCFGRNDWITMRWDMGFLQPLWPDYELEDERMQFMLSWFANRTLGSGLVDFDYEQSLNVGYGYAIEKVLLEPHLKERYEGNSDVLRFQGCRAARHDDHIHVQIQELVAINAFPIF